MAPRRYRLLYGKISAMIAQPARRAALYSAMQRSRQSRSNAMAQISDAHAFRRGVRRIKERSIARLDELVAKFASNARRRGARVYFAADANAAVTYVMELAKARGVKLVSKSKSLTSEEIEMNHPLEKAGIRVVETDLGEWIIQAAHEKPYHLVFPAVHRTRLEVADMLTREVGTPVEADTSKITAAIRSHLRNIFVSTDMGVTGANVAIAETGTLVLETNEGNARLVSNIPPIHVAIVGMEKIVESWEEAAELVLAHPLSATGQRLTNYVSFISGRSPLAGKERELHIIILDNGRSQMKEDPWFRDALNCIRCGACMNICPTYGVVGGHIFGYIYPGPIGIPWTAQAHGLDKAAEFAPLCIACGLCKEICPVDIDIPLMIAKVKELDVKESGQLFVNEALSDVEGFARLASATAPLSNWILQRRLTRYLMDKIIGIERRRPLPDFKRETFVKWFRKQRRGEGTRAGRVVYFVDLYANYNQPALAKATVALLEQLGVEVDVPPQKSSGMPYIAYGELQKATRLAQDNISVLHPYVKDGCKIVTTEPTAAYMLRHVYPKLVNAEGAKDVAENTLEFFDYVERFAAETLFAQKALNFSKKAGFHISCHQRALSGGGPTLNLLRRLGMDIQVVETGTCCGMAGTFGLKKGPLGYQLSMEVGKPLFDLFRNAGVDVIVTESSVCSMHLQHGTGLPVVHPITLVYESSISTT